MFADLFEVRTYSNISECEATSEANKLHAAVVDNDLPMVLNKLSDDASQVDELNIFGETPLYVAVEKDNPAIVCVLLSHRARVRKDTVICDSTSEGVSEWKNPLHVVKSRAVVDMLLDAGADINDKNYQGDTVLHTSARCRNFDVVGCLVNRMCVDVLNRTGLTPLHEIVRGKETDLRILRLLLANGADINAQTLTGRTPLHCACGMEKPMATVRELLSNRARLDIADFAGVYPIHICIISVYNKERLELSSLLVNSVDIRSLKDARGRTMLHSAAESCGKDVVETIVTKSSCVNEPDNFGRTPLHYAALNKDNSEVISCLIANGAIINYVDTWGQTALHEAIRVENVDALKELLADNSCDVNMKDLTGVTALHVACLNNSLISVKQLSLHLADLNCCDKNKSSALHFAAWNGDTDTVLAELLSKECVDIFQKDVLGKTCLDIAIFRRNSKIYSVLTECEQMSQKSKIFSELSSVGNKKMKYSEVLELVNKDGAIRSIADAKQYVSKVLTLPGVGRGTDEYEAKEIQVAIEDMIQTLAERIGHIDSRFKCVVLHAGSMSEGTKTRLPDEFDFMFCLEEFSKHCEPTFHDDTLGEDTYSLHNLTKRHRTRHDSLTDHPSIVKIKDNAESDAFLTSAGSTCMRASAIGCVFCQLLKKAIFDKTVTKNPQLMPIDIVVRFPAGLRVQWRGSMYKHLDIDIDIFPAILLSHWHKYTRKDSVLMTRDIFSIPCVAVPKVVHVVDLDQWRSSMALVETGIFRKLRPEIRNSYIACKALVTFHILPDITSDTYDASEEISRHDIGKCLKSYIVKMSFLHAIEKKANRDGLGSVYSKTTTEISMNVDEYALNLSSEQKDETMRSDKDRVKENQETIYTRISMYGPASEMNVAEQCADFDMELVREVFQRCDEYVAHRFLPSIFNAKENVLRNILSFKYELIKLGTYIKLIRKLIE